MHKMPELRRSQFIYMLNTQIERGWITAKRLEGWSEKQIARSIEKLEHLKAAHQKMREEREKQTIENGGIVLK